MDYHNLLQIIQKRRSIRSYKPTPVPLENVMQVLEAARWSVSGNNSQPWEFVVVRDAEQKKRIVEIMSAQSRQLREKTVNFKHAPDKKYLDDVSTLIFVCGDPRFKPAYPRAENEEDDVLYRENRDLIFIETVSAAICNILLAATALGLATVWLTGTAEGATETRLKAVLNIPEPLQIICCIPLGYASTEPPPNRQPRPLESMVHFDKFDASKWRTDDEVQHFISDKQVWAEFFKTGQIK